MRNLPALVLLVLAACGGRTPRGGADAAMARCIPPQAQALAGVDLDRLGSLAETIRTRLGAPEGTKTLLVAELGSDVLLIAGGHFAETPAGATMIAPGVAAIGSAGAVAAAASQYRAGPKAVSELPALGEKLAGSAPLWGVIRGGVMLPLSGNMANLNRLLGSTEYTEFTVQPGESYSVSITGICRSPAEAEQLERTLRGFLALAKAAKGNQEAVSGVEIHMKDRTVGVSLIVPRATVESLLH